MTINLHVHPLYKYLLQGGRGGLMAEEQWTLERRPAPALPQLQFLPTCIGEKPEGGGHLQHPLI